jgi:hypothetical protein
VDRRTYQYPALVKVDASYIWRAISPPGLSAVQNFTETIITLSAQNPTLSIILGRYDTLPLTCRYSTQLRCFYIFIYQQKQVQLYYSISCHSGTPKEPQTPSFQSNFISHGDPNRSARYRLCSHLSCSLRRDREMLVSLTSFLGILLGIPERRPY